MLTDDESARVCSRAAAARVSVPRLLVEAALARDTATVSERRALVVELLAARRLVAETGNHLSELTTAAHAAGQMGPEVTAARRRPGAPPSG